MPPPAAPACVTQGCPTHARPARCVAPGCGALIKWMTGPGRTPERCPAHKALHQRGLHPPLHAAPPGSRSPGMSADPHRIPPRHPDRAAEQVTVPAPAGTQAAVAAAALEAGVPETAWLQAALTFLLELPAETRAQIAAAAAADALAEADWLAEALPLVALLDTPVRARIRQAAAAEEIPPGLWLHRAALFTGGLTAAERTTITRAARVATRSAASAR